MNVFFQRESSRREMQGAPPRLASPPWPSSVPAATRRSRAMRCSRGAKGTACCQLCSRARRELCIWPRTRKAAFVLFIYFDTNTSFNACARAGGGLRGVPSVCVYLQRERCCWRRARGVAATGSTEKREIMYYNQCD